MTTISPAEPADAIARARAHSPFLRALLERGGPVVDAVLAGDFEGALRLARAEAAGPDVEVALRRERAGYALAVGIWTIGHVSHIFFTSTAGMLIARIPLAIGEIITSRWECLPLFQNHWIDFIRTAPIHVGGITEIRRICILADAYFVRTAFHGAQDLGPVGQAAAIQVDLAIPNFGVQEWVDFPPELYEVISGTCYLENGMAYPPEKPGLGVDLNEEEAKKYPYQQAYMPTHRRSDGTIHLY